MDKVSKDRIARLHPSVREEVTAIVNACNEKLSGRAQVRIAQGLRTMAEQADLYAQGRTKPGKVVTNAKAGQSIHNYGLAVDIVLIIDGKAASWDRNTDFDGDKLPDWMECVGVFKSHGWMWGGDWKSLKDYPHFEKPGYTWQALQKKPAGKDGYVIL